MKMIIDQDVTSCIACCINDVKDTRSKSKETKINRQFNVLTLNIKYISLVIGYFKFQKLCLISVKKEMHIQCQTIELHLYMQQFEVIVVLTLTYFLHTINGTCKLFGSNEKLPINTVFLLTITCLSCIVRGLFSFFVYLIICFSNRSVHVFCLIVCRVEVNVVVLLMSK